MTTAAGLERLGTFVSAATPPPAARAAAATAFLDTIGVTLAGAAEPAARIVQELVAEESAGASVVVGTMRRASASGAAFANGTAAHALDYDDMCFVSLAHPSAPLVPAALAAAETSAASGRAALDAYVIGFELEARLGRLMNPRHYERGWHCTATLGTIGAAAAASRLLRLDATAAARALGIAASEASGLKENFGTMVKPLHAGLAARNGITAARLARGGMTASAQALEGAQGFLKAFDSSGNALPDAIADLGTRWEIVETGISVKLYPSCAATHPPLDAILDLRREHGFRAEDVERIDVGVDAITPNVLIYERAATPLEGKFSMPFCAAAAVAYGRVGVDTFDPVTLADAAIRSLMARVHLRADPALDGVGPPLTEARVRVALRDGRALERAAHGARGYPQQPASDAELAAKFLSCATRVMTRAGAERALEITRAIDGLDDVRALTSALVPEL